MNAILIHLHPDCARCARIAQVHHAFDWLGQINDTTEAPSTGPLRLGEVVVNDLQSGTLHRGADAFDRICRATPLYGPLRMLLRVPAFRAYVERSMGGCDDGVCDVR